MKRFARFAAMLLAGAAFAGLSQAQQLSVEASKTVPVRLSASASSVIIGNKNIADVAVHNERLVFVTGKSFGTTNLLIYDRSGREIYNSEIMVTTNSSNLLTINRAGLSQTYDCSPVCRSTLGIGDDPAYFDRLMQQQLQTKALSEGN